MCVTDRHDMTLVVKVALSFSQTSPGSVLIKLEFVLN